MVNTIPKNPKKIWLLISLVLVIAVGIGGFFFLQKTREVEVFSQKKPSEAKEKPPSFEPSLLSWAEAVPNAAWSGRDAHATIVFKGKIWLLGGVEGGSTKKSPVYEEIPHKSDIWVSENGKDWKLVKEKAEWGERRSAGVVVFKDKIWLMGGWTKKWGETKNDIWVSEDGLNWEIAVSSAPWSPREGHTIVVFNNKICLAGGVDFFKREVKNDVWCSEDGIRWTEVIARASWSPRYDHTLTVFKNKLWLIGGLYFGNQVKKDVWLSEDGKNWQLVSDTPPWFSRHGHISLEYQERLWIIGGWSEEAGKGLNDIWVSEDGYNWKKTEKDGPWQGREDHSVVVFEDRIWMMGGMADAGDSWVWKNDIWYSTISIE